MTDIETLLNELKEIKEELNSVKNYVKSMFHNITELITYIIEIDELETHYICVEHDKEDCTDCVGTEEIEAHKKQKKH